MKINTTCNYLSALSLFVSTKDPRRYLHGIHFYITGDFLQAEATNGHIAMRCKSAGSAEGLDDAGVILVLDSRLMTEVNKPKNSCEAVQAWQVEGFSWAAKFDGVTYPLTAIDAKFPDVDRVIPSDKDFIKTPDDEKFPHVSAKYLELIGKAGSRLMHGKGNKAVQVLTRSKKESLLVKYAEKDAIAVLMPLRV